MLPGCLQLTLQSLAESLVELAAEHNQKGHYPSIFTPFTGWP